MAEEEEGFSVLPARYNEFIKKHQQDQGYASKNEETVDFVSGGHNSRPSTKDAFLYPAMDGNDGDEEGDEAYAPASTPMRGFPAIRITSLFGGGGGGGASLVAGQVRTDDYDEDADDHDQDHEGAARKAPVFGGAYPVLGAHFGVPGSNRRFSVFVLSLLLFALIVVTAAGLIYSKENPNAESSFGANSHPGAGTKANPNNKENQTYFYGDSFTPTITATPTMPGGAVSRSDPNADTDTDTEPPLPTPPVNGTAPTPSPVRVSPPPPVNSVWKRRGTDMIGRASGDLLGESIVLNGRGDVVAVGSPGANERQGTVQVFYYYNRTWNEMGGIIQGVGQFGVSLDLSDDGTILAVGGHLAPTSIDESVKGHVRVYRFVDNIHEWSPMGDALEGDQQNENLGWSVSLSGDGLALAVGSPAYGRNKQGRVQLFFYHAQQWHLNPGQIPMDPNDKGTGHFVSMSNNGYRVAVVSTNNQQPRVTVWQRFNNTFWHPMGAPIENLGNELDHLGQRVQLSGDGNTLVLAARFNNQNGYTQTYLWESGHWREKGQTIDAVEDLDGDGIADDHTACSVSDDGTHIAIGSPLDAGGRVRVYQLTNGWWYQVGEDVQGPQGFGDAVAISGNAMHLAVGAAHYNEEIGLVRVYARHSENE